MEQFSQIVLGRTIGMCAAILLRSLLAENRIRVAYLISCLAKLFGFLHISGR